MKLIKKILRIIAILLPVYCCCFISSDSFANSYGFTSLPVYDPFLYSERTNSYYSAGYNWDISTPITSQSPIATFKSQSYNPVSNYPLCDSPSSSSYLSSTTSLNYYISGIKFYGYVPDSRLTPPGCNLIRPDSTWYDYSSIKIGTYHINNTDTTSSVSVSYQGDSIDSTFNVSSSYGLNLTSSFFEYEFYSPNNNFTDYTINPFSIPLYVNEPLLYNDSDSRYANHSHELIVSFIAANNYKEGAAKFENEFIVPEGTSASLSYTYYNSSRSLWVSDSVSCTYLLLNDDGRLDFLCKFEDFTGPVLDGLSYNHLVFDGKSPVFMKFKFPDGIKFSEGLSSYLYLNNVSLSIDEPGVYPRDLNYVGTLGFIDGGDNPDSAPQGDYNSSDSSFLSLFNFDIFNPFSILFSYFTSPDHCVHIPHLANFLHVSNDSVCPLYPEPVYFILTPVFGLLAYMVLFSYIMKWLRDDSSTYISIKGGKP